MLKQQVQVVSTVQPGGNHSYMTPQLLPQPAHPPAPPGAPMPDPPAETPMLLVFGSVRSGLSRQVDGYIAHALQRRSNHDVFRVRTVHIEERPDLFERFGVHDVPTLMIIAGGAVERRWDGPIRPARLQEFLQPWLR